MIPKMNGIEAACCGAEVTENHCSVCDLIRLAVRPVNSDFEFDIFIRILPYQNNKYYRKRGSASDIVREVLSVREREREIQREREKDGSDVTIVALKLAMNLHTRLPKIRTIGDWLTLPLPKIRTFRFSLHRGHHCGAENRNKFTLSMPKIFSPSLFPLFY